MKISILLILIVTILVLILIFHYSIWTFIKRQYTKGAEFERSKSDLVITYPKYLKTDEDFNDYIASNRHNFPPEKQWDALLPMLLKEMITAGWDSEMPIYTYENFRDYDIKVVANDSNLQQELNQIIFRYSEKYR